MSYWSAHAVVASNATAAAQTAPSAQRSDCATAKAFLLSQPTGGVFTCARATRDGRALVLWRFHLERLALGLRLTHEGADEALVSALQSTSTRLCKSVARSCAAAESRADVDLMVTTLWWRDADACFHVSAHACVMPVPTSVTSSTVLVYGSGRDHARCKHTDWISARVPLEAHTRAVDASMGPIHETVLSRYDPAANDTLLLEGLLSNFFVVKSGTVFTAADGVLLGSTRALVLRACEELGIPVVLEPPRLSERALWTAAFVTSAVRIAVSVTRVLFPTSGPDGLEELQLADVDGIAERIRQHITTRRFFTADGSDVY